MARGISAVEGFALYLLHYMGHVIIASVGYGGSEVGYLQRGEVDLALTYGDGDDGEAVPRALIGIVIIVAVRYETSLLAWQVDARLIAKAHRHHIVAPAVHGVDHTAILAPIAYHIIQSPAEESVA